MLDSYHKDFIKLLHEMSSTRFIVDVFSDVVGMFASAIEAGMSKRSAECEERYQRLVSKYTKAEADCIPKLLGTLVCALEKKRESFLGPILEEIGASNAKNGQFLTPASVANMCGRICAGDTKHTDGELIKVSDPACGCGVLLISQAEAMLERGIPQKDIYLEGGDIDLRACDCTFTELSLLGYAARVDHADALSMKQISRPRWTIGFYLYGTQWKLLRKAVV